MANIPNTGVFILLNGNINENIEEIKNQAIGTFNMVKNTIDENIDVIKQNASNPYPLVLNQSRENLDKVKQAGADAREFVLENTSLLTNVVAPLVDKVTNTSTLLNGTFNTKRMERSEQNNNSDYIDNGRTFELISAEENADIYDNNKYPNFNDKGNGLKTSYLGRGKIVENLTFLKSVQNVGQTETVGLTSSISQDFSFERALLKVTQDKNIITTKIMGKDGTIKEYIGLDDYKIQIEAFIYGYNGIYPYDKVKQLEEYLVYNRVIPVACGFLNNIFDINYITIKDFDISMEEGSVSQQKVTITALSDNLYEESLFTPYTS
jgi:hypothetical protein